jgi:hypothetical protein
VVVKKCQRKILRKTMPGKPFLTRKLMHFSLMNIAKKSEICVKNEIIQQWRL